MSCHYRTHNVKLITYNLQPITHYQAWSPTNGTNLNVSSSILS